MAKLDLTPRNPFSATQPPAGLICDVDGTLTESKSPMDQSMAKVITKWLEYGYQFAAITGGKLAQLEEQFISQLKCGSSLFTQIQLFPASGSSMYAWHHDTATWQSVYNEAFTDAEKSSIYAALAAARLEPALDIPDPTTAYGPQIEDRDGQITLSALGQQAPWQEKKNWDPDRAKRIAIVRFLEPLLPSLDIKYGGSTSIDITKPGINKAYGVTKWWEHTKLGPQNTLFLGDRLEPGGNDHIVLTTGIPAQAVAGPEETAQIIISIL